MFGTAGEDLVSYRIPSVESRMCEIPAGPVASSARLIELKEKGHQWNILLIIFFFLSLTYSGLQKLMQFLLQASKKSTTLKKFSSGLITNEELAIDHADWIKTEEDFSLCEYGLQNTSPRAADVTPPRIREPLTSTNVQGDTLLLAPALQLYDSVLDRRDALDDASQDLGNVEGLLALSDSEWERHCQGSVVKRRGRFKDDSSGSFGGLRMIHQND